jgi:tRNA threonylcarbamoyladenosine biosynthesis protein TsaE
MTKLVYSAFAGKGNALAHRLAVNWGGSYSIDSMRLEKITASAAETETLGETIGRRLQGGEVIELSSDLGGGKTTLMRGLARGAGSADVVGSPTFTLSKVYQAARLQIHHFDFYRLAEAGIMHEELQELVDDPQLVVAVEWSDIVKDVLPAERLTINLQRMADHEDARRIIVEYPDELQYLVEGIES